VSRLPIRWRLTLYYTATMVVIVLALILAMFAILGTQQVNRLQDRVADCAWIAEANVTSTGSLDIALLDGSGCAGIGIAVLDARGAILERTGVPAGPGETHPGDLWHTVLATGQARGEHRTATFAGNDEPRYGYAVPLAADAAPARVIVASLPYAAMGADLIFLVPVIIAGAAILAVIVIAIASYFLVRSSLAPVTAITDAAREISAQDLSRRLPVRNPRDELGRLSLTINDLLARMEVALVQRERALAEQRRFVADASHELRTPLTSILGYTRMLQQWGLDNPDVAREGAAALEQEAGRMHALVESLLRLARGDELPAMTPTPQDLGAIVRRAAAAARAFAAEIPIEAEVPDEPVIAEVDREMLLQALEVLLDNAVRHAATTEPVHVVLEAADGHAVVRISDRGAGIAPEHLPHIFDRFYRADQARATPGSGLGLAIARQVVERHGGEIGVESAVGQGTTFTIRLPLAGESSR
jgi:signal transduction histidine kinase